MSGGLSVRDAATRTRRSVRTIERWIAEELLDLVVVSDLQGRVIRRYVDEAQLLEVLRAKLRANPARRSKPDDVTPP